MKTKFALVSDFDGTISDDDFFFYITDKYSNQISLEPWQQYLDGKKTHFDALKEIFAQLCIDKNEFDKLVQKVRIDHKFFKAAELCNQLSIPLCICSAGCDYYIRILIGDELKKYNITLITNPSSYDEVSGLKLLRPSDELYYYDFDTGVAKNKVVKKLQNEGYKVIYCGDGIPDFGASKIADVVFAKKTLLKKCLNAQISTLPFGDFDDVLKFIKENT